MARIAIFLYGLIVYALFFATFCYLFAFMNGYFVPKHVDSGEPGPIAFSIILNLALVGLFGVQHAVMARPAFKRWITRFIPAAMERSTFVLAASVILILLYWLWQPIPIVIWHIEAPILRGIVHGIFIIGMLTVLLSSFLIDHFDLFGLRQVFLNLRGVNYTHRPFVERSLYKLVRHPLMLGFLISLWAAPTMTIGHALFSAAMSLYIFIGIQMEERDLIRQHNADYLEYRRRTPMILPRVGRRPAADRVVEVRNPTAARAGEAASPTH